MKRWIFLILLAFLLTGCTGKVPEKPQVSTVERIEVEGENGSCVIQTQEGMSAVLCGLRQLQNMGRAKEDPEALESENYLIRLYLSDGRQVRYYFRSGGYLSKNEGAWQRLDATGTQRFLRLLRIITA